MDPPSDLGTFRRNKAAYLSHQYNQSHLSNVVDFPAMFGPVTIASRTVRHPALYR